MQDEKITNNEWSEKKLRNIHDLQGRLFGSRFIGASFAAVSLPKQHAERFIEWIKNPNMFLVIFGPPGIGKTYMCSAMIEYAAQRFATFRAFSERQLFERIRQGISSNIGDFLTNLHLLIDDDLLILDDIGSSSHNEWREGLLMDAIDFRYAKKGATIFTSNLSKDDFYKNYGARIGTRLFAKENTILDLSDMPNQRDFGK